MAARVAVGLLGLVVFVGCGRVSSVSRGVAGAPNGAASDGGGAGASSAAGGEAGMGDATIPLRPPLSVGVYSIPRLPESPATAGLSGFERTTSIFYVADDASWVLGTSVVRPLATQQGQPVSHQVFGWTPRAQVSLGPDLEPIALDRDAANVVLRRGSVGSTGVCSAPCVTGAWAASSGFVPFPELPIAAGFALAGVSADTRTFAGAVVHDLGGELYQYQPALWQPPKAAVVLENLPGFSNCQLETLSGDGRHAFGVCYNGVRNQPGSDVLGIHWSEAAGLEPLSKLLGRVGCTAYVGPHVVNQNGSVLIGACGHDGFIWTLQDGLTTVPSASFSDFTEDGAVGALYREPTLSAVVASRWSRATGEQPLLPLAPDDTTTLPQPVDESRVGGGVVGTRAMSLDGAVLAGTASDSAVSSGASDRAFRWTAGGLRALPALEGDAWSHVTSVSRDGAIIVGYTGSASGPHAVFWDATGAVHSVADAVSAAGLDLGKLQLLTTEGAVNAHILWGTAGPGSDTHSWLVRLP